MKTVYALLFLLIFFAANAQEVLPPSDSLRALVEGRTQAVVLDLVNPDILKWSASTQIFDYKPAQVFPEISHPDGTMKEKREVGGDVITWSEEVTRAWYRAMQDSVSHYLMLYSQNADSGATEDILYRTFINQKTVQVFGADLKILLDMLPPVNPQNPEEIGMVHKYLFVYFEKTYFLKGELNLNEFNDSNRDQFPFLYAVSKTVSFVK